MSNNDSHAHQGAKQQPILVNTYGIKDVPAAIRFGVGARDGVQVVDEHHEMTPGDYRDRNRR